MPATLVLLRHGQSVWNAENRFTGWVDVPLSEQGWREAEAAGRTLAAMRFDAAYSSHLQRAIATLLVVLRENRAGRVPIFVPAPGTVPREEYTLAAHEFPAILHVTALAERHYGALQGLNKDEVLARHGEAQFKAWRRGYATPPPGGESLADTVGRAVPYFRREIVPRLRAGQCVLIAAHGNSLRALTKHLEGISDADIAALEIPTGIPIAYTLEVHDETVQVAGKRILEAGA